METIVAVEAVLQVAQHSTDSIEQAYQVHCQVTYAPWQLATFTDCTTPPYQMITLSSPTVSGYAIVLMVADEATLMDIGVTSACRGLGYGKLLLDKVIQICTQKQMSAIWLEVRASNNTALNLYKSHGFAEQERRKNYYDSDLGKEDALIMKRQVLSI